MVDDSYAISRYIFSLKFKKIYTAMCHDRCLKGYKIKAVLRGIRSKPY